MPNYRVSPSFAGPDKTVVVHMGGKSYRTTRETLTSRGQRNYLAAAARNDWKEMQREIPEIKTRYINGAVSDYLMLWVRDGKLPPAMPIAALEVLPREADRLHMDDLMHEVKHVYPLREAVRKNSGDVATRLTLLNALTGRISTEKLGKKFDKAMTYDSPGREKLARFVANATGSFPEYNMEFLVVAERALPGSEGDALRSYFTSQATAHRKSLAKQISDESASDACDPRKLDSLARCLVVAPHDDNDVEGRDKEFADWLARVPPNSSAHSILLAAHARFTQDSKRVRHAQTLYELPIFQRNFERGKPMSPTSPVISPLTGTPSNAPAKPVLPIRYNDWHKHQPETVLGDPGDFFELLHRSTHAEVVNDAERGPCLAPVNTNSVGFPRVLDWLRDGKLPPNISADDQGLVLMEARRWGMKALQYEMKHVYPLRAKARGTAATVNDKLAILNINAPRLSDERLAYKLEKALASDTPLRQGLHRYISKGENPLSGKGKKPLSSKGKSPLSAFDARFLRAAQEQVLTTECLDSLHAFWETPDEEKSEDLRRVVGELVELKDQSGDESKRADMHRKAVEKLIDVAEDVAELRSMGESTDNTATKLRIAERILQFSQAEDDLLSAATLHMQSHDGGQKVFERLQNVDLAPAERRDPWLKMVGVYVLSHKDPVRAAWLCHALGSTFEEFTQHVSDHTQEYHYDQEYVTRKHYTRHYDAPSSEGETTDTYEARKRAAAPRNAQKLEAKKATDVKDVLDAWKKIDQSFMTPTRRMALEKFEADVEAWKAGKAAAKAKVKAAAKEETSGKSAAATGTNGEGSSAAPAKKSLWRRR